jgi:hypothetical protein
MAQGYGPEWDGGKGTELLELDLNKFCPIPVDVLRNKKDNRSDAFNSGGYEWCCANWGTKWGVYDVELTVTKGATSYRFQTAWAPFSVDVLQKMAQMFPKLKFSLKFGEQGSAFVGEYRGEAGDAWEENYAQGKDFKKAINKDPELKELADCSG